MGTPVTSDPANRGLLLIISGPSGVGKTTITHRVKVRLNAVFSVSVTTRPITSEDTDGVDYHFVDIAQFKRYRDGGNLLEWAKVFGNYYGTPRRPVEENLADGRLMILEIDVEGAIQIKKNMPDSFALFIDPPNEDTLLQRLRARQREDEQTIRGRFSRAKHEIARARECGVYDGFIVNDELDKAVDQAVKAVADELTRRRKSQTQKV
jgi:guanylate kinase